MNTLGQQAGFQTQMGESYGWLHLYQKAQHSSNSKVQSEDTKVTRITNVWVELFPLKIYDTLNL